MGRLTVVQVFKTTLSEFKNREKYVRGDFRLANEFKKQNPRKIMKMWAEKEMLNLKRMKKFGITCPEVCVWFQLYDIVGCECDSSVYTSAMCLGLYVYRYMYSKHKFCWPTTSSINDLRCFKL